ncbi:MAG: amino acid adenylation domain-containing protein [Candidatus Solibacter sp.]
MAGTEISTSNWAPAETIVRRNSGDRAPLSYAQEGLWFLQQLHPSNAVYTETWVVRIAGGIRREALQRSLDDIVRRHEILRTIFPTEDGRPVQVTLPAAEIELRVIDVSPVDTQREADSLIAIETEHVFDLARGPLLRAVLLRLTEIESLFVFSMHHIICDGISARVFLGELETAYAVFAEDRPFRSSELPFQFPDYAAWERRRFEKHAEKNLQFWKEFLSELPISELPTDRPRPPVQSFRGATESVRISDSVAAAVNLFAARENASPFMILLCAFQILLSRYTGQTDIVVGSPISDRPPGGGDELIGLFINATVIRTNLSGAPTVTEALARVRQATIQALDHRQVPFERLVDAVKPERDLSRNPLFQIVFAFEPCGNAPAGPVSKWTARPAERRVAKFDLTMIVEEEPGGLIVRVEYCTDLFGSTWVRRLIRHYESLLEAISSQPETRIPELPLLTESELHQVLCEWNSTQRAYPSDSLLHHLFTRQALRAPDTIALVDGDDHITYGEVERRSDRLAGYLAVRGVGPEIPVGVSLARSPEMAIAILGILKAGGGYVPVDPALPLERRAFLLSDSRATALVTTKSAEVPSEFQTKAVLLDEHWKRIDEQRSAALESVSAEGLACVIYTSGSTGVPKGVAITHRGVCRMVFDPGNVTISPTDSVSQISPFAFDASTFEIWGALLNGARLVILGRDIILSTGAFRTEIARQQFSVMFLTTALFHQIARQEPAMLMEVRTVLVGGETADPTAFRRVLEAGPPVRLLHMYGPAEAVTYASRFHVRSVAKESESIAIGRPVANLFLYILDRDLNPVPVGVPGELFVAGDCFARGYLHRPELTAERFVPDLWGTSPGARMYRTGDRARYLPDGSIEFLGRLDNQVKLRGFRIELEEIEAVLLRHPAVSQAAVAMRQREDGHRELVAYVSLGTESRPGVADLKVFLQNSLPDYMVPPVISILDRLPCNTNGKVDRRALPEPECEYGRDLDYAAPRNPVEESLAVIWAEALGLPRIGIHDNFFAAGGDSILTIQIVARAVKAGLNVTPQALFQNQTVAALAAVCGGPVRTQPAVVTGPAPLTPIQQWFLEDEPADAHHFNQAVCLDLMRAVSSDRMETALQGIAQRHGALRSRLDSRNQNWSQADAQDKDGWPLERIDLSSLSPAEQDSVYLEHAARIQSSLNLTAGPLARAAVFDLGATRPARLILVAHHLVVDAVSWRIILEDLESACLNEGRAGPHHAIGTTPFEMWARRLQQYADSQEVRGELSRWLLLEGCDTPLPVDHHSGRDDFASERIFTCSLSAEETQSLLYSVPKAYRTQINDALLCALLIAMNQWRGDCNLVFNLEGHGREPLFEELDLSHSVGWFTSLLPVRLQIERDATPGDALLSVKEQLRGIPGRGVGFGVLRYLCSDPDVRRSLAALPQPEICFNYLGQMDAVLRDSKLFRWSEYTGPEVSPRQARRHKLTVDAFVRHGRLQCDWAFSSNRYRPETIERLGASMIEALGAIIRQSATPGAGRYINADFPLAKLARSALDGLWRLDRFIEDVYPLSPMQKGMLFHTLYAPGSGAYFEQFQFTIEGALDHAALFRAWNRVIERHPILRTSFFGEGIDEAVQVVRKPSPAVWEELDWRSLETAAGDGHFRDFLRRDRERGFALFAAPPLRLTLVRSGDTEHQLVWSFHHALLDGWSISIILREVFASYEAFRSGREPALNPPQNWRHYIEWLSKQDGSLGKAFWQEHLRGFMAPTALPLERPAAEGFAEGYGEVAACLSEETTAVLDSFIRREHLTLNTAVQAAWALLLSRYSGENDVLFGTTVSGRPAGLKGVESMAGMFLCTLPVRIRVAPSRPVAVWLRELQDGLAEIRQREHVSLVDLHGWSDVAPGAPLFESILVFENYPVDPALHETGQSLGIVQAKLHEQTTYPLSLLAMPGKELRITAVFDVRRYDSQSAARILDHLLVLLQEMATKPGCRVGELSLMTPVEQRNLLSWAAPAAEHLETRAAHKLFEVQANLAPEVGAIEYDGITLNYGELNRRANQLAWWLQSLGVGAEVRVGVSLERSPEMVIALLAVLKAGGAFVPLDPRYPLERLSFMWADSDIAVLVTTKALLDRFPEHRRPVVFADADCAQYATWNQANPVGPVSLASLAYVIYTSGSSGTPKGVLLTHGGLSNLVKAQVEAFGCNKQSRVLQFASLNFDAAVSEIFVTLVAGSTLVLASQDELAPGEVLAGCLRRKSVSLVTLPPTVLQTIPLSESLPELTTIVSAGEACPSALVQHWSAGRRFLNAYGPTEITVCATIASEVEPAHPSIGRPIPGARVFVLNDDLRIQPAGVVGELFVAGAGVARGYLNQPELTAAVFIPDPFGEAPGGRLYRTGDMGRWLSDGSIEFVGRRDHQVKLRGFRIELGEVEAAVGRLPGVREAAVMVRDTDNGDRHLVAYLVAESTAPSDDLFLPDLRMALRRRLPEYMIPAEFVRIDAMPRSSSGKLERKSLPALQSMHTQSTLRASSASNPLEEILCGIWDDVLGRKGTGAGDNFFEVGGHSLNATKVILRVRNSFRVDVTLRALFEHPTVAAFARFLAAQTGSAAPYEMQQIRKVARTGDLALSFAQQRLWFIHELDAGASLYNCPLALQISGPLNRAAIERTLDEIVRRHEILRTRFFAREGLPFQVIGTPAHLPVADIDRGDRSLVEILAEELARPFDLRNGPVVRATLVHESQNRNVLMLTMHHIVCDGWSRGVLLDEIIRLYQAFSHERTPELEEPQTQYADFAAWQRSSLQGAALRAELDYWRETFQGCPPPIRLPFDRARPPVSCHAGACLSVTLPSELTRSLRELSARQGATLFMTLLAGFQALLHRLGGQDDFAVGVAASGRSRVETERLIGFFLNMLVLRSDVSGNPTFIELLTRARESVLGAFAHQDVPFDKLVEELQPDRSEGTDPLFQVAFGLDRPPLSFVKLAEVEIAVLEPEVNTARYDLTLWITERADQFEASWTYRTDLFDASTIERMHRRFESMLADAVLRPEARVAELEWRTRAEVEQAAVQQQSRDISKRRKLLTSTPKVITTSSGIRN